MIARHAHLSVDSDDIGFDAADLDRELIADRLQKDVVSHCLSSYSASQSWHEAHRRRCCSVFSCSIRARCMSPSPKVSVTSTLLARRRLAPRAHFRLVPDVARPVTSIDSRLLDTVQRSSRHSHLCCCFTRLPVAVHELQGRLHHQVGSQRAPVDPVHLHLPSRTHHSSRLPRQTHARVGETSPRRR